MVTVIAKSFAVLPELETTKTTVPLIRTIAGPLASDRPTRQLRKVGQRHKGNRLRDAVGAHVKIILPLQETIGRSAFDGLDQPD